MISKLQVATLPHKSVTVNVTVVTPGTNTLPLGISGTIDAIPQSSVTTGSS